MFLSDFFITLCTWFSEEGTALEKNITKNSNVSNPKIRKNLSLNPNLVHNFGKDLFFVGGGVRFF